MNTENNHSHSERNTLKESRGHILTSKKELYQDPCDHQHFPQYVKIFGKPGTSTAGTQTRPLLQGYPCYSYILPKGSYADPNPALHPGPFPSHQVEWSNFVKLLHEFASYKIAQFELRNSTEEKSTENTLQSRHPHLYQDFPSPDPFQGKPSNPPKRGMLTLLLPRRGENGEKSCFVLSTNSLTMRSPYGRQKDEAKRNTHSLEIFAKLQSYKRIVSSKNTNLCILLPPPSPEFTISPKELSNTSWDYLPWELYRTPIPFLYPNRVPTLVIDMCDIMSPEPINWFKQVTRSHSSVQNENEVPQKEDEPTNKTNTPKPPKRRFFSKHYQNLLQATLNKSAFKARSSPVQQTGTKETLPAKLFLQADNLLFPNDPNNRWEQPESGSFRAIHACQHTKAFLAALAKMEAECVFCFGNHPAEHCQSFLQLSKQERWACVRDRLQFKDFCLICLKDKHDSRCHTIYCGDISCRLHPPHHPLLH